MGKNPATGKDIRIGTYRLKDNYTRFYLKYIAPHKQEIALGTYKYIALEHLPNWHAIMGLQFENLIVNNAMDVVPHLGLELRLFIDGRRDGCGQPCHCQHKEVKS